MSEPLPNELLIEAWNASVGASLDRCLTQRACGRAEGGEDGQSLAQHGDGGGAEKEGRGKKKGLRKEGECLFQN